jgi:hypothetical protein
MSRRYSTFHQVFYSITGVEVSEAAVIQRRSLATSCTFVWYTKSFMYSHRKKSKGAELGEGVLSHGSQVTAACETVTPVML